MSTRNSMSDVIKSNNLVAMTINKYNTSIRDTEFMTNTATTEFKASFTFYYAGFDRSQLNSYFLFCIEFKNYIYEFRL